MELINKLEAIADAIREKTGTTDELNLEQMAAAINAIAIDTEPGVVFPPITNKYTITSQLSAIGNAIRAKTGGQYMLTLDEMPDAIRSINAGGATVNYVEAVGLTYKFYHYLDNTGYYGYFKVAGKGTCTGGNIDIPLYASKDGRQYYFAGFESEALEAWAELTGIRVQERSIWLDESAMNIHVGEAAFHGCRNLKYVEMDVHSVGQEVFGACSSLITVKFSSKCFNIGRRTFEGCTNLRLFEIAGDYYSENRTVIWPHTFNGCHNLNYVRFVSPVQLHPHAFNNCSNLTQVKIGPDETYGFPMNYRVGPFAAHAFANCPNLTTLILTGGNIGDLNTLGEVSSDYGNCKNYTSGGSCEGFERYELFYNCPNVTDIYVPWIEGYYEGAPWGATNATIHYNSGGEQ